MMTQTMREEIALMSCSQLDELVSLIQNRRNMINSLAALKLCVGQIVTFEGKHGQTISGTIDKMTRSGRLSLINCSDGMTWSMPASMVK